MSNKESAIFKGLIKCKLCHSNFGRIVENKINHKYICNAYRKGRCIKRVVVDEKIILWLVTRNRVQINESLTPTNEFMKSIIAKIEVEETGNFTIYYKDGTQSIYSQNVIQC